MCLDLVNVYPIKDQETNIDPHSPPPYSSPAMGRSEKIFSSLPIYETAENGKKTCCKWKNGKTFTPILKKLLLVLAMAVCESGLAKPEATTKMNEGNFFRQQFCIFFLLWGFFIFLFCILLFIVVRSVLSGSRVEERWTKWKKKCVPACLPCTRSAPSTTRLLPPFFSLIFNLFNFFLQLEFYCLLLGSAKALYLPYLRNVSYDSLTWRILFVAMCLYFYIWMFFFLIFL